MLGFMAQPLFLFRALGTFDIAPATPSALGACLPLVNCGAVRILISLVQPSRHLARPGANFAIARATLSALCDTLCVCVGWIGLVVVRC